METKLRIAFVKDWHDDLESQAGNFDGILAAIAELSKRHKLEFITRGTGECQHINRIFYRFADFIESKLLQFKPDVIVCWGSLDRPWHGMLPKDIPALLCFAGGPTHHEFLSNFRHIFVESQVYLDDFRSRGISSSRAFGTNTSIFRPEPRTPKIFDSLYPASFCFHKDQEVFARAIGSRGLAVGNWNELDIAGKCLQLGLPILRRVSSNVLTDLYNLSRTVCIPSGPGGGSQRVCLESMACGTPVVCSVDNDKCREFVQESGFGKLAEPVPEAIREAIYELIASPPSPQVGIEYIRSKWTEHHYASALESGIREVLNHV